ncbi:MAG: glycerate kinase [Rhodobacterales bacterium]|nr:MAG: glycerate kinase [Rhodobacterales bacterium]
MTGALRSRAVAIFNAGVAAADPYQAVAQALQTQPMPPPDMGGQTIIIAFGKAATAMARAAAAVVAEPRQIIVVTNPENACPLPFATTHAAGHPVPDENGLIAGRAVMEMLHHATARDRILALISGGGSALLPAPVAGLSLSDKAEVNRLLLGCGAGIGQINLIRQQLSQLKGGGMLRLAAPARLRALVLSDVIGNDMRLIASGPTAGPVGDKAQAIELLRRYGLWQRVPEAVRAHLSAPQARMPALPEAENQLVGSNEISLSAMHTAAGQAMVHDCPLIGDVAQAAEIIAQSGPGITLFGGETTVRLQGNGKGGRNQELALRLALLAEEQGWAPGWVFLSGGTDGRDGPTDAAGGLVDAGSLRRMRAKGVDPQAMLADNDSYHALQAAEDLLITGATGTNVADLQVLIRP